LTSVPGADFTGQPVSGVAPLTVHFTALNASVLSSCTWTFGDGSSQTFTPPVGQTSFSICPSVDHVYDTAGSFTVTLSVRKVTGASNAVTKVDYIVVTAPPEITITPTNELPVGTPTATPTQLCWDC
jgi:PKD repeat protein